MLLLLPLEEGNGWGWGSAKVIGSLVAAVVVLTVFVLVERRMTHPLVSTRMLTHRPIVVANLAGPVPRFLHVRRVPGRFRAGADAARGGGYGFGASVLAASLVYLLPGTASGVITAPLGGRLVSRFGAKTTLVIAAVLAGLGFGMLAVLHDATLAGHRGRAGGQHRCHVRLRGAAHIAHRPCRTGRDRHREQCELDRPLGRYVAGHRVRGHHDDARPDRRTGAAAAGVPVRDRLRDRHGPGRARRRHGRVRLPRSRRPNPTVSEAEADDVLGAAGLDVPVAPARA